MSLSVYSTVYTEAACGEAMHLTDVLCIGSVHRNYMQDLHWSERDILSRALKLDITLLKSQDYMLTQS